MDGCLEKGFIILLVCSIVFWAIQGASSIYYPFRLYNTGTDTVATINEKEKKIVTVTRVDSTYGYKRYVTDTFPYFEVKFLNSSIRAEISYNRGKHIETGDLAHVFINPRLKRGVFLGDNRSNLFNLLFYYNAFSVDYLLLDLLFIVIFLIAFVVNTGIVVFGIISDQKEKIEKEKSIIVKGGMYAKAFIPFVSYLLFSTFFLLLLIRGVYAVEAENEFLAGFIFLLCFVTAIVSPRFLYLLVKYIRDSSNNVVKSLKYTVSVSFAIWGTYKLVNIVFSNSITSKATILDVLRDFLKSLVSG